MKYVMPFLFKDFSCLQYGDCCHNWNIDVAAEEFATIMQDLKTLDSKEIPESGGFDVIRDEEGKIAEVVLKVVDNHCGFLVDNRCFLHCRFGMQGKPKICQAYPFYAVKTPDIIYISASLACPCTARLLCCDVPPKMIYPPLKLGRDFMVKSSSYSPHIQLSSKQTTMWQGFYYMQQFLLSRIDFTYIDGIWKEIEKHPQQHFSSAELKALCKKFQPQNSFADPQQHVALIAEIVLQFSDDLQPQISKFFQFLGSDFRDALFIHNYEEMFWCYQSQLPQDLWNIFNNYIYVLLFSCDVYISHSIQKYLSLVGLAIGLVHFFNMMTIYEKNCHITSELLISNISLVERYFFHADNSEAINSVNVSPAIAASPV